MKQIILKGKEGNVAIMSLVDGADVEEAVRKFRDVFPEGDWPEYMEGEEFLTPLSREFRDAWKLSAKNEIVVCANRAKDIHLGRIREARDAQLEKLDRAAMRHIASPEELKRIEEEKQALRDIPQKLAGLEWPKGLPLC